MSSKLIWKNNNCIATYSGHLDMEVVQKVISQVLSNPRFEKQQYQISDFTAVESTSLEEIDIKMIGAMDRNANRWNETLYCAYVINEGIQDLMDLYFKEMKETDWVINVFYNLQDAKNWIASHGFEVD